MSATHTPTSTPTSTLIDSVEYINIFELIEKYKLTGIYTSLSISDTIKQINILYDNIKSIYNNLENRYKNKNLYTLYTSDIQYRILIYKRGTNLYKIDKQIELLHLLNVLYLIELLFNKLTQNTNFILKNINNICDKIVNIINIIKYKPISNNTSISVPLEQYLQDFHDVKFKIDNLVTANEKSINTKLINENNYSLAKSMISSQNQTILEERNIEARAYIHALLTTINDLIPKITRRQIPVLVNETKREINKLLVNKNISVSDKDLSYIINEILSE